MPRVGCKLCFPNDRCSAISYIRLLLHDCMLKAHQHRIGLEASNSCDCVLGIDDIEYFLLLCTLYDDLRQVLKQDVTKVWERCESRGSMNLSVQLLLLPFASDQVTYVECCDILSGTFNYIRNSQRQLQLQTLSSLHISSSSIQCHYQLTTSVKTTCELKVIYQRK